MALDEFHQFQIINSWLSNSRALIAAAKIQRWDVVKWTTALNVAIGTVSLSGVLKVEMSRAQLWSLFVLAVFVALIGATLVWHYSRRMLGARREALRFSKKINEIYPVGKIVDEDFRQPGAGYDCEELLAFALVIAMSIVPALAALLLRT